MVFVLVLTSFAVTMKKICQKEVHQCCTVLGICWQLTITFIVASHSFVIGCLRIVFITEQSHPWDAKDTSSGQFGLKDKPSGSVFAKKLLKAKYVSQPMTMHNRSAFQTDEDYHGAMLSIIPVMQW